MNVTDESQAPDAIQFRTRTGSIHSDLTIGAAVVEARQLKANDKIASNGCALNGAGFILDRPTAEKLTAGTDAMGLVVKPYRNGRDLMASPRMAFVIDLFGYTEIEVQRRWPAIYQHVALNVKPVRAARSDRTADAAQYAAQWWLFQKPRPGLRQALRGLERYIATVETTKHRVFQFLDHTILPDHMLIAVADADAHTLGVLSSRFHVVWALAAGARLGVGDDPRYSKSRCFDPFPFPADVSEQLKARIRAEAEALDTLRKRVLAEHNDLTLTKLYNVLQALREERAN
ncbi:MAG TPA: type IIL restriction-modification enzyme MmeI [Terriglobales bacterium]|nr:type IIL restriction-modification enzyme MmeI [Terriglobales bacterium]